ncbi:PREDICTED: uncharacterized protein LOC104825404 [Tarenaya hassleriana]|uniref:uncharacterized protein LOC104825404 n=1 Tax=Tarenaya hassleriana TaxID=28532 RepID=UPI00053C5B53|nr:PREDICTED: uncharacterized protein LOC104825404 [Tarenaya hassleriana]
MASTRLKLHSQSFKTINSSSQSSPHETLILHLPFSESFSHNSRLQISSVPSNLHRKPTTRFLPLCFSVPSVSSPPTSKEEAILQARTCLTSCLLKSINNPKLASAKLKKLKQPRFRVEIPLVDEDSPSSLSKLASSIFDDLPISRKGSKSKIIILWPDSSFAEAAAGEFRSYSIQNTGIDSVLDTGKNRPALNSADVAVFMAPEISKIEEVETVAEVFYPKPVLMMNPRWVFDEEKTLGEEFSRFVGSFEVIYAFTGLEVRGVLSKRRGVIFKFVRDGVLSGERWSVLVEEEEKDKALKLVSSFKARPSMEEVETVLYNLMAMNSPITKSARFLRDLVSNITGKK